MSLQGKVILCGTDGIKYKIRIGWGLMVKNKVKKTIVNSCSRVDQNKKTKDKKG